MHLELNNTYPFVLVTCERKGFIPGRIRPFDKSGFFTPTFRPWDYDLLEIKVFNLKCVEQVESKGEFSGDTGTGYILESDQPVQGATRWGYNYPSFYEGNSENAKVELLIEEYSKEKGFDHIWIREFVEGGYPYALTDARHMLQEVRRSIYHLRKQGDDGKAEQLKCHYDHLVKVLNEHGYDVECTRLMVERGEENLERAKEIENLLRPHVGDQKVIDQSEDLREVASRLQVTIPMDYPEAAYLPSCQTRMWLAGWYNVNITRVHTGE